MSEETSTSHAFISVFGKRISKKIICAVLRTESEMIRMFDIPCGGDFIKFNNDMLIWSLTGDKISVNEKIEFEYRSDLPKIKDYAIKVFKKNNFQGSPDLKDVNIEFGLNNTIIICHKLTDTKLIYKENKLNIISAFFKKMYNKIRLLIVRS